MIDHVILNRLRDIEQEHDVTILYACESGSRAWGFASPDSDYDVRFIYTQSLDRYLSIEPMHKTIDIPIEGELDFHGWSLAKAIGLIAKGNAAMIEWLHSPITYRKDKQFHQEALDVLPRTLQLIRCFAHYRSMVATVYTKDIKNKEDVRLKSYFYALRPLLAARWIRERSTFPPVNFIELTEILDRSGEDQAVRETLAVMLAWKCRSDEKYLVPADPILNAYILQQTRELETVMYELEEPNLKPLNELMKCTVLRV